MAITFVGSHVGTHAAVSAQTVNFSSLLDASGGTPTLLQNDIVYVSVENSTTVDRGAGALVPSGYTAAHTADYRNDSNRSNFQVSYKVMGATPDTSVAIPASNATSAGVAYSIYVFRGVNTTTPHSATPVVTGATNTGIANAAAITPNSADTGAWIVAFGGAAVAAGAVFTNPAGMSTTTNHFRTATITTTTNDANIGTALYTAWTSGAYDPAAFGGSTSTNTGSWSAVTVALKPVVSHDTSGTPTGQGSEVVGSANRQSPVVTHDTSGALTADIGSIVGSAARADAVVDHATTGVLTGAGSAVAGSATRYRQFATTGALTGQIGSIAGAATRFRAFATSGVLTGQLGSVAGTAQHNIPHPTSGDLVGQIGSISGAATRYRQFATSGALTGDIGSVSGAASRTGAVITHATTGALVGDGAVVSGDATRYRQFATSGDLVAQLGSIDGMAAHIVKHDSSGSLTGEASVVGEASRAAPGPVEHIATGDLIGAGAELSGAALRMGNTLLTEADIAAIAAAVWSRGLPLGDAPLVNYGTTSLRAADIEAISYAVWAKSLP